MHLWRNNVFTIPDIFISAFVAKVVFVYVLICESVAKIVLKIPCFHS